MVPPIPIDPGPPREEDLVRIDGDAGAYGPGTVRTGSSPGRAWVPLGGPRGLTPRVPGTLGAVLAYKNISSILVQAPDQWPCTGHRTSTDQLHAPLLCSFKKSADSCLGSSVPCSGCPPCHPTGTAHSVRTSSGIGFRAS